MAESDNMNSDRDWETFVDGPITPKPAPWETKATIYIIPFWTSGQTAKHLPPKSYSPLEGASAFASKEFGVPVGGMSTVQLLRYTDTPAGPYDELILNPGYFEHPVETDNGKKATKKSLRITRIYVSQKQTCWNGRTLWNIPKHLARFEWTDSPDGSTRVKVFPHDTHTPYDATEAKPSDTPFFQCTIKSMSYIPSFPMTSSLFKYMGIDTSLVQPPLPQGETELGELPGTERWAKLAGFVQYAPKASLAWADMSQKGEDGKAPDEYDNFFPGLSRWNVAVKLLGGGASFPAAETWETPKGAL